jgi:hypothetical protein
MKSDRQKMIDQTENRCVQPSCRRLHSGGKDELHARLIREARRSDRGAARYSVNDLRAQRGLPTI